MKKFHIDHQNVRKIAGVLYGIGIVLALLSLIWPVPPLPGVLLILAGLVVMLLYWRCPNCEKVLPLRAWNIQYCPYCGGKL